MDHPTLKTPLLNWKYEHSPALGSQPSGCWFRGAWQNSVLPWPHKPALLQRGWAGSAGQQEDQRRCATQPYNHEQGREPQHTIPTHNSGRGRTSSSTRVLGVEDGAVTEGGTTWGWPTGAAGSCSEVPKGPAGHGGVSNQARRGDAQVCH